jgi:hypothetical protein
VRLVGFPASTCPLRPPCEASIARPVPQPGQKTSSHGVPAISAARMVGDRSMSRPVASRRFQRSITASASRRAARSAFSLAAPALMSSPRVRTPIAPVSGRGPQKSIRRSEGRCGTEQLTARESVNAFQEPTADDSRRPADASPSFPRAGRDAILSAQSAGNQIRAEKLFHPGGSTRRNGSRCRARQPKGG